MKLRWGDERIKHFSKPVKTVERAGIGWLFWLTGGVCVGTIIWFWYKTFQLYAIHLWVSNM